MPLTIKGSCQCERIKFSVETSTPVPYQFCACSICRKCGGYGGAVNLGGFAESLKVLEGSEFVKKYKATKRPENTKCTSERSFCSECSTMLWLWAPEWPELIHPFASCIDSELPVPEEMVCVRGDSKPEWVRWPEGKKEVHEEFGGDSIEGWHKRHKLWVE